MRTELSHSERPFGGDANHEFATMATLVAEDDSMVRTNGDEVVMGVEKMALLRRAERRPPPKVESTLTVTVARGVPVGIESNVELYILHVSVTTALVMVLCQAKNSKPETVIACGEGYHWAKALPLVVLLMVSGLNAVDLLNT